MSAPRRSLAPLLFAALAPLGFVGCGLGPVKQTVSPTEAIRADRALPEETLLDVGIHVLETPAGGADAPAAAAAAAEGSDPKIREAEARYIPFHLKKTLQNTGQWGAVRVVPARAEEVDVGVSGKLLESNGETLRVEFKVVDATGRLWFHHEYAAQATEKSYAAPKGTDRDPYQDLYNQVANDMLAYRQRLTAKESAAIRQVAQLKFARSVVPDAFAGYLATDGDGTVKVSRLPADNDPMVERVNRVRAREYMFIDTVNVHYENLYDDMRQPYEEWRKAYLVELNQQRELERQVWARRLLGIAAIVGAVVLGTNSNSSGSQVASTLLVIGGYEAIRSSGQLAADAKVHEAALKELGASFKADVAPVVDEVEGRTIKLSGSVDAQFAEWRKTLRELLAAETGVPPAAAPPALSAEPGSKPQ
ncbi:MAG TPA: hypothetical protein VJM14_02490 [Burkholderiales bacterium]|nr:hypothetical protein [Burkholderiales bacterium]